MAQTIRLWGATYNQVGGVDLPKYGGGTARFTDVTPTTAAASDVASGKYFVTANGVLTEGGAVARTSSDLQVWDEVVVVPAGIYSEQASAEVPTTTVATPTATKGSVSNHSVTVTPSITQTYGYVSSTTKTGTPVTVTASELVSGNLSITQNGNNINCANYATVSVSVSGSSKNVQIVQSTTRATSSTYTNCISLTCSVAGTYDVYWSCMRSSTSGTSGSQLYVGGSAYGTADTTTWSNHVQNKHLTGVALTKNQTVAVYARSRGSNYYAYVPTLVIIQS